MQPARIQSEPIRQYIAPNLASLERGARGCRKLAKMSFGKWLWAFGNLPQEQRDGIYALLALLHFGNQALEVRAAVPKTESPCDELREDLSEAMVGRIASSELHFITHTVEQFRVPKQHVFDLLEGLDRIWRFGQPETYDEAQTTAVRLGGSFVLSAVHVLGINKPDFERFASHCGQAITLTWWLIHLVDDAERGTIRLPKSDLMECEVDTNLLRQRSATKTLHHFVRMYGHRVDQLLASGGHLFDHLGYDGKRVLRSVLGVCWKALCNVRLDPDRLLQTGQAFTEKDLFACRAKQFLGLDANLPFASSESTGH
jgi:phytoene/squalene synthetase